MAHQITEQPLTLSHIDRLLRQNLQLQLGEQVIEATRRCREYVTSAILNSDKAVYGINTGFGALCKVKIAPEHLRRLQQNLVRSHACGCGEPLPVEMVRLMLVLKVYSLSKGHSGIRLETLERLVWLFNNHVTPVVFEQGSLGASGDLIPLAHLSLPLMGEGEVWIDGERVPASEIAVRYGVQPLQFEAKEGLALLNGTQLMQALGVWCLLHSRRLLHLFRFSAALSLEAWSASPDPFHPAIQAVRPFAGQQSEAAGILELLQGSQIFSHPDKNLQDPYSFRCIPQVHGAASDTITYVESVFHTEMNAVTDNPLIFPSDDLVLSGGNFHGQPLALASDFLAIALSELGSISERRIFQLLGGNRGLPEFLVAGSGLNSGLMIPQYMAASLVSQNKQYCTPASADSINSSNGQEDHVSMGANSVLKMYRIILNLQRIAAAEVLTAAQALEFRRPLRSSAAVERFMAGYRQVVPFLTEDRILHTDLENTHGYLTQTFTGPEPLLPLLSPN